MVNEKGKLLDHEGKVLSLNYPISKEDRRKLLKDIKEYLQPTISERAAFQVEKALEPIKRGIMQLELSTENSFAKVHKRMETEVKLMTSKFSKDLADAKESLEQTLTAVQRLRARDATNNDLRHKKNEEDIQKQQEMLGEHAQHFESIASVTTMLLENINLQMEAECADLLDRKFVALYGAQAGDLDKVDVTGTDTKIKGTVPAQKQPLLNEKSTLPLSESVNADNSGSDAILPKIRQVSQPPAESRVIPPITMN